MTLDNFLALAVTGGGIGLIISLLAEYMPYFADIMDKFSSEGKRLFVLGLCELIPLGVVAFRVFVQHAPSVPDLWWNAIFAGFAAFASSQVTHLLVRER